MKKIPTAFKRIYENHEVIDVLDEYTNELCEEAVKYGIAKEKLDGMV